MMNKRMICKMTAILLAAAFLLTACGAKQTAPVGTAEESAYRVAVTDEAGDPVPGVLIQFCSDTLCMAEETGQDGTVSWKAEAGTYTVHVLKAPEGYAEDPAEYAAPEKPGTVVITLLKAEGQEKP